MFINYNCRFWTFNKLLLIIFFLLTLNKCDHNDKNNTIKQSEKNFMNLHTYIDSLKNNKIKLIIDTTGYNTPIGKISLNSMDVIKYDKNIDKNGLYLENALFTKYIGNYVNGKREGKWFIYFENGWNINEVVNYINDNKYGISYCYFENKINCIGNYINDLKDGEWIWYDKNEIEYKIWFKKGNSTKEEYFKRKGYIFDVCYKEYENDRERTLKVNNSKDIYEYLWRRTFGENSLNFLPKSKYISYYNKMKLVREDFFLNGKLSKQKEYDSQERIIYEKKYDHKSEDPLYNIISSKETIYSNGVDPMVTETIYDGTGNGLYNIKIIKQWTPDGSAIYPDNDVVYSEYYYNGDKIVKTFFKLRNGTSFWEYSNTY